MDVIITVIIPPPPQRGSKHFTMINLTKDKMQVMRKCTKYDGQNVNGRVVEASLKKSKQNF